MRMKILEQMIKNGDVELRTDLFPKKRILSKRLRSQKGASVVFAIVGFMFAAMISLVVVNAAYSAAARLRRQKYDEQAFLLAQSMSSVITEELTGTSGTSGEASGGATLSNDGITISYQYIEHKNSASGVVEKLYNSSWDKNLFNKSTSTRKFTVIESSTSLVKVEDVTSMQSMILAMANVIANSGTGTPVTETLTTSASPNGDNYVVSATFTMDSSYSLTVDIDATITAGSQTVNYHLGMDIPSVVRKDIKLWPATVTDDSITVNFGSTEETGSETPSGGGESGGVVGEETSESSETKLIKVTYYTITWPFDQINIRTGQIS